MNVLIIGFYSSLRKAELTLFNPLLERLEKIEKIEKIFVPTPFPYLENTYGELKKFKKIEVKNFFSLPCLIKSILSSKVILGVFGDALTKRHNFLSQVYNYFPLLLTFALGKKTILISNTLFIPAFPTLLSLGKKNVKYCSTRDVKSYFLSKKLFENTCKLSTDISFNFFKDVSPKNGGKKLIVCLRNNSHKIAGINRKVYSSILAELILKICHSLNLKEILFLAMDFGIRKAGMDYLIHEEIKAKLKESNLKIDSVKYAQNLNALIEKFDSGSFVLTSRFHGIVFSVCLEKPFLVIDNDYKTFYFMKNYNLEKFYVSPKNIKNVKLGEILKESCRLKKKLKRIKKEILKKSENHLNEIINLITQ
jgi:polysaccharide pyruvyl transferase WcaK-like protein